MPVTNFLRERKCNLICHLTLPSYWKDELHIPRCVFSNSWHDTQRRCDSFCSFKFGFPTVCSHLTPPARPTLPLCLHDCGSGCCVSWSSLRKETVIWWEIWGVSSGCSKDGAFESVINYKKTEDNLVYTTRLSADPEHPPEMLLQSTSSPQGTALQRGLHS